MNREAKEQDVDKERETGERMGCGRGEKRDKGKERRGADGIGERRKMREEERD